MPLLHGYLIIAGVGIFAIIVYQLHSLIYIGKWAQKSKFRKRTGIILSIFKDCLVPVILLIILPKIVSVLINRGVNIREALNMQPDVAISIIIVSMVFCAKVITKIIVTIKA